MPVVEIVGYQADGGLSITRLNTSERLIWAVGNEAARMLREGECIAAEGWEIDRNGSRKRRRGRWWLGGGTDPRYPTWKDAVASSRDKTAKLPRHRPPC